MTFSDYIDYLRDKRIGVIGFGVSNQPLVRVLLQNGCDVTVCDRRSSARPGMRPRRRARNSPLARTISSIWTLM